ncbi:NPH3 domain-containing protein [Dioscorea alata]|uniref:NPH3 domain-containing protein n=1 Tax=Dioscorea alata TaxID=55571 RepID=A0ACB7UPD8_DIOAL|nr:NPH3 domain-containing protein [Dioscorea alata]
MEGACVLEVDVNGEEKFFVDKNVLSRYSGRLSKLFGKTSVTGTPKTLKVIFHGLPGGPDAFELMTKFCYNNGSIQITPINTLLLHFVAHFMEMTHDLIMQTEKSLECIPYWTWSETLIAFQQCQEFFQASNSSGVLDKIIDSLVRRIVTTSDTSPLSSSPDSSNLRLSFDTRSTLSMRNSNHPSSWFEDLLILNSDTIEKFINCMVSRKVDHATISRFLFYYLKHRNLNAPTDEKRKNTEIIIGLLYSLDTDSFSFKSLFGILRMSSSLDLSKCCRSRLESMVGSQVDEATLDSLLVPAADQGMQCLYDVNLVLRFLRYFLQSSVQICVKRLKKVGSLMDLYITEVAPDPKLKPSKFVALITALPDSSRESHDAMYRAIDMYLQVHSGLAQEEKMKICCAINYEKLSSESCKHLAGNSKFPSRTAMQALITQHSKLKNLLQDTNCLRKFRNSTHKEQQMNDTENEQVILYAKRVDISMEDEKLKAHLEGMQWKAMELEKICRKIQNQMTRIMKIKLCSPNGGLRSLPKLCS